MINYRKGSVHQGDTKIINVANIRSPKYMKKTLTELKENCAVLQCGMAFKSR